MCSGQEREGKRNKIVWRVGNLFLKSNWAWLYGPCAPKCTDTGRPCSACDQSLVHQGFITAPALTTYFSNLLHPASCRSLFPWCDGFEYKDPGVFFFLQRKIVGGWTVNWVAMLRLAPLARSTARPFSSHFVLRTERKDLSGEFPPKYSRLIDPTMELSCEIEMDLWVVWMDRDVYGDEPLLVFKNYLLLLGFQPWILLWRNE